MPKHHRYDAKLFQKIALIMAEANCISAARRVSFSLRPTENSGGIRRGRLLLRLIRKPPSIRLWLFGSRRLPRQSSP